MTADKNGVADATQQIVDSNVRARLESAVRKLGPIAAQNALTAFASGQAGNWDSCVLARAYGANGELYSAANGVEPGLRRLGWMCKALGITMSEMGAVVDAFDRSPEYDDGRRVLLRSLLEAEASKLNAAAVDLAEQREAPSLVGSEGR